MNTIENLMGATEELYTLLLCLNRKVFSHDDIIKRLSIPPSHAKVIFHLHCGGEASVSEIAKNLSISKSNMTPIIDKLISYGLVNRYTDEKDRRILRIELTELAFKFFNSFKDYAKSALLDKIAILPDDDLKEAQYCIEKLTSIFLKLS